MNLETCKNVGIHFDYCRYAVFPQIPRVQDVLYVLRLSDQKDAHGSYCLEGAANWGPYIANLMLVAAAVASKVLYMERYDEAEARKIIGQAILDLTRPKDRCLFSSVLAEAAEAVTGKPAPSRTADCDTLLAVCGCWGCREQRDDFGSVDDYEGCE